MEGGGAAFAAAPEQVAEIPALGLEYANALIDRAEQTGDPALLRRAVEAATDVLQRERSPGAYDARATAAWMLYQDEKNSDDLRRAESDFAAEAALSPNEARVWASLSEMRLYLEAWDGALEAIDRALELEPSERYRAWRERILKAKKESEF